MCDTLNSTVVSGSGVGFGHHGELLQGVFADECGVATRALVTLPNSTVRSRVRCLATTVPGRIESSPLWARKSRDAFLLAAEHFGVCGISGAVSIESRAPMSCGYGTSTADVVATIRAVADAFDKHIDGDEIAALAVRAETACDSTMFDGNAVLFAQREGRVLDVYDAAVPTFVVVGFESGPRVDTLSFRPPAYQRRERTRFEELRELCGLAINTTDRVLLGSVATGSARINQRYLPKPHLDLAMAVCDELGGVGIQVSHSGSLVGLLFDPTENDVAARVNAACKELMCRGIERVASFMTSENNEPTEQGDGSGRSDLLLL